MTDTNQDVTKEKDLTEEMQNIIHVVDEMGKHCDEEDLLRDMFHHKHSTVKRNFKKKMKDLRDVIEHSPHADVATEREIHSIDDAVAFLFLDKEYRQFLGSVLIVAQRVVKKTKQSEEKPLVLELLGLARMMNRHPEYRKIFRVFFDCASKLETLDLSHEILTPVADSHKNFNSRKFVEEWVGDDYSIYKLLSYLVELQKAQHKDESLSKLFSSWKHWILVSSLSNVDIEDKSAIINDTERLVETSRSLALSPMYKLLIHHVSIEISYLFSQINKEDNLNELRDRFSDLAKGLILNEEGKPTFKTELFENAGTIAHCLLDSIQHIALPSIHKKTEKTELRLDDVVIDSTDIKPSALEIKNDGSALTIRVSNIKAQLKKVNFYFQRFDSKLITKSVSGVADINITGSKGMTIEIILVTRVLGGEDKVYSLFEVQSSTCTISKLKIRLRDTQHDKLYKILSPLINKVATKKLEQSVAQYVALYISKLNAVSTSKANDAIKEKKLQLTKFSQEKVSLSLVPEY